MAIKARALGAGVSALAILAAQHASAQSTAATGSGGAAANGAGGGAGTPTVEEIIVTAQKRSERLSDVPLSITAQTGAQLEKRGVTQVADLEKVVPGFTYQPSTYGSPVFTLRGIGFFDNAVAIPPAVSLYVDQVPLPYAVMSEGVLLDVERVEALKGPQGTLFGENSTGGAVNFIANKPTPHFDAGASVTYGNFNAVNVNGFASGPLTDTVSARVALNTDQRDDWQRSETRGAALGQRNFTDGRILLDWKPRDDLRFELNLNGWVDRSDTQAAQFVAYVPGTPNSKYNNLAPALSTYAPAPRDDRVADWDPNSSFRRKDQFYQASLRSDWNLTPSITATSITAFSDLRQDSPIDPDGTNLDVFRLTILSKIFSLSQELRLSGTAIDNRLKWLIGANYENDSTNDHQLGYDDGSNSGVGPLRFHNFININDQIINTSAVFGSLDYLLPYNLTVTGSARFTQSDDSFSGCVRDTGQGDLAAAFSLVAAKRILPGACATLNPTTRVAPPIVNEVLNQNNESWRTGLSWKPNSATLVYGNVTRGYKAGSFPTVPGLVPAEFAPVPQESVLTYEAGFKRALLRRSLQVTGALFYSDYTDKQIEGYVSTAFGKLPSLVSVPKSSVKGAEFDATWKPIEALTFTGGATYVDTRVDKDFVTYSPLNTLIDVKGEQFPATPRWQLNGDAEYDFPVHDDLRGYVAASGRYRSSSFGQFGEQSLFRIDGYGILDLRAGLQSDAGHWRAELWGRNVTNKFYTTGITHVIDTVAQTTGMPTTYGVTLSYKY